MKLVLKPVYDAEDDVFKITFSEPPPNGEQRLRDLFQSWMEERTRQAVCSCWVKILDVKYSPGKCRAKVICGWFCDKVSGLL